MNIQIGKCCKDVNWKATADPVIGSDGRFHARACVDARHGAARREMTGEERFSFDAWREWANEVAKSKTPSTCACGWRLPAHGMHGECASDAPFNTDLAVRVVFACPACGAEFETELALVRQRKAGESYPEAS